MILVSLFASITCILSVVAIPLPFTPVPITLQILAVTMSGAILGGKLGALSQGIYVLLGAIGLPVYAGGQAGVGILFGPTGGYLFGFILGSFVIGTLIQQGMKKGFALKVEYPIIVVSMLVGLAVIYIWGVLQLMLVTKMNFVEAFVGGVLPFILADAAKVVAGSIIAFGMRRTISKTVGYLV